MPGDANFDGKVDINDLTIVLSNYGETVGASWTNGDFNGDGRVDINDLTIVLANYGRTAGASVAVAAVPEPSTVLLAAFGGGRLAGLRHAEAEITDKSDYRRTVPDAGTRFVAGSCSASPSRCSSSTRSKDRLLRAICRSGGLQNG